MSESPLPLPHVEARTIAESGLTLLTDNALAQSCGVRVVFTGRQGGVSAAPYESLNLGSHVGDDLSAVLENRKRLVQAFGQNDLPLIVPHQVHGVHCVTIDSSDPRALAAFQKEADKGADALVVAASRVGALLCFADCVPLIMVAPNGAFAVAHAGWRGCVGQVASKTVARLAEASGESPAEMNVYVGPHIGPECFEVGPEVVRQFEETFGNGCVVDSRHIDLSAALKTDLSYAGVNPERISDVGICTVCVQDDYYSYRASGGICGRHGAFAFKEEVLL